MENIWVFVQENVFNVVLVGAALQIFGSAVLGLFSFLGLKISENKDAYIEGTLMVEVPSGWMWAAKISLVVLLVGVAISALGALASISLG
ncbi:hypothetical protein [Halomonas sp. PR-M31]|uniref:hypothetical protein n=1 Tax=Halomonas sp. PR-M31 TaxID=1471202 RepID=UPI000651E375|nr:hypothetical protein [Halomonas sp. PR-M31]